MDGITSGAHRNSKRVKTDPLAIEKECQHEQCKCTKNDAPRPSTPPPEHPRLLTDYINPPCQQGQIKSQSGKIRRMKTKKSTHRIVWPHRGQIRHIKRIGDAAYEVQMLGEPILARYQHSTTLQRSRILDHAHSALPKP